MHQNIHNQKFKEEGHLWGGCWALTMMSLSSETGPCQSGTRTSGRRCWFLWGWFQVMKISHTRIQLLLERRQCCSREEDVCWGATPTKRSKQEGANPCSSSTLQLFLGTLLARASQGAANKAGSKGCRLLAPTRYKHGWRICSTSPGWVLGCTWWEWQMLPVFIVCSLELRGEAVVNK